jgi:hypothetical protein
MRNGGGKSLTSRGAGRSHVERKRDASAYEKLEAQPLDSVLVDEALPAAIEQAAALVRRNNAQPLKVEALRSVAAEAFPQEALATRILL